MSPVFMDLDTLIPFALIAALTLLVFYITHVVEGYEAPKSAADSLKRIFASTGWFLAGILVASIILKGRLALDDIWPSLVGGLFAITVIFMVDVTVLTLSSRRKSDTSE